VALFRAAVFHEGQVSRNSSSYGQKSGRELSLACRALWSKIAAPAVPAVLLQSWPLPTLPDCRDCWPPAKATSHGRPVKARQRNNYHVQSGMEEGQR